MKTAVVFGARQFFGFEICSQLLDKGYYVHAIDHQNWQKKDHKDKWLFIGRNANLKYTNIEEQTDVFRQTNIPELPYLYIFPLVDYYSCNDSIVRDQLTIMLEELATSPSPSESLFIFLQPSAFPMNDSQFNGKMEELITEIRNEHKVFEYSLLISEYIHEDHFFYINNEEAANWERVENGSHAKHEQVEELVKKVITHLEKKVKSYTNEKNDMGKLPFPD